MFKLKFGMLPGHWGLVGKTREIAKAEYELTGYDLDKRLLEIEQPGYTISDYSRRYIDMNFNHGKITKKEQLRQLVNLIEDEGQRNLASLELDFKEGILTDTQYQKQSATLKKEPWVTVLSMDFGGKQSLEGSFELDWNEYFVENLKKDGYLGPTPDTIVNQWFMEVCRNVALEEFDGTGDFTADSAANLETIKRWNSSEPVGNDRKGYK